MGYQASGGSSAADQMAAAATGPEASDQDEAGPATPLSVEPTDEPEAKPAAEPGAAPGAEPGAAPAAEPGAEPGAAPPTEPGAEPPLAQFATDQPATPAATPPAPPLPPRDLTKSPSLNAADQAGYSRMAIDDLAQKMLLGQFKPSDYKGADQPIGLARRREMEMRQQLDNIRNDPRIDSKEKVFAATNAVSPIIASDVRGIVNGVTMPPRGINSAKPPWDTIFSLAQKADPSLDAATMQTRAATKRYYSAGQGAQQLIKLGTAYDHGGALLDKLQNQPSAFMEILANFPGVPKAVLDRMFPGTSAKIAAMEADIRTFASETGSVLAYGPGSMREREEIKGDIDWSRPHAAIARVNDIMQRLRDREAQLKEGFVRGTKMNYDEFIGSFGNEHPEAQGGLRQMHGVPPDQQGAVDYREYLKD
jgi:hypothetical protein